MVNYLHLKTALKTAIRVEQLKNKNFFAITFNNKKKHKSFKLTKKQFSNNNIAKVLNIKETKFPLNLSIFSSEKELKANSSGVNILKLNEYVFIKKKDLNLYTNKTYNIYTKIFKLISPNYLFNLIENTKQNKF